MKNFKGIIPLFSQENNPKKYSEMLMEMMANFEQELLMFDDFDEILEFSVNTWNLACVSNLFPKDEFKKIIETGANSVDADTIQILKKMMHWKNKNYPKETRCIAEYFIEIKDGEEVLSVVTEDQNSFMERVLNEKNNFEIDPSNFEPGFINRVAITIRAKKPLFDWITELDPNSSDFDDEPSTYLISDEIEDIEAWLKKNYDRIFREELEGWWDIKKEWPQKRSYKMFREWFDVFVSTIVYDMENTPVEKE